MGLNHFVFDDINSNDFGVFISGGGTFSAPQRDFNMVEVPGRNGALIIENDRYKNIDVDYPAFILRDIHSNLDGLRAALSSKRGYCRLEDDYHPDEYRLATFSNGFFPKMGAGNRYATFTIQFNAMPQRFLKSGETKQTFTASGSTIVNPTLFDAKPLVRIYANAGSYPTITINGISNAIRNIDEYVDVDCETQNAYKGTVNMNQWMHNKTFWKLSAGENRITFSSSVTKIEIIPRWWTL